MFLMNGQNDFGGQVASHPQDNPQSEWAPRPNGWSDSTDSNPPTSSYEPVQGAGSGSFSQDSQPQFGMPHRPATAQQAAMQTTAPAAPTQQFGSGQFGSSQMGTGQFGADQPGQPGQMAQPGQTGMQQFNQPPAPQNGGSARSNGRKVGVLTAAALVLLGGGVGGAIGGAMASNSDAGVVNALKEAPASSGKPSPEGSIESVADKVLPSVVSIMVETGNTGEQGSGSLLSSDGLVLTNFHVVGAAEKPGAVLAVRLNDGQVHEADYVAGDPSSDIAVIKIRDVKGLTPIQLGNSDDLKVGQTVVAIGSPLGLTSTVTSGIVSAKNRPVRAGGENGGTQTIIDAIQTDAAINPGNSGGPLVDLAGNLIGINSVISTTSEKSGSIGLGFAIPINQARRIADELIEKGKATRSIINASIDSRPSVLGARIVRVVDGGAADRAGLKAGDIVVKVGDRSISNGDGLIAAIRSHQVGETVKLTVLDENGKNERQVDVTIEAASE